MEICGGQTHTIVKFGIDELLPEQITLVHGPGCPVCVTPLELIDKAIAIAAPAGRDLHLLRRHAARAGLGHRPADGQGAGRRRAHRLFAAGRREAGADNTPDRQVVFFAVGFETTAPGQRHGGLAGASSSG